jgi:hypothetical protein
MQTLLEEDNVISLRTALILDDGNSVHFRLMPADFGALSLKVLEWVTKDSAYLYRHLRLTDEEAALMNGPSSLEQDLKPMTFEESPVFRLLWADSGNGVALYLNGEPWAFINEATHLGYSKGILPPKRGPAIGNVWDQVLFERIFPSAPRGIG